VSESVSLQACIQYSSFGLTNDKYNFKKISVFLFTNVLLIMPRVLLAALAAATHWLLLYSDDTYKYNKGLRLETGHGRWTKKKLNFKVTIFCEVEYLKNGEWAKLLYYTNIGNYT